MTIQQEIKDQLKVSMKNRTTELTGILRVTLSEFDRIGKEVTDEQALKVIKKLNQNAIDQNNKHEQLIYDSHYH